MSFILWVVPSLKIDQCLLKEIEKETGEVFFNWKGKSTVIKNIPLLYKENGQSVSVVNNWLIYLKSSKYRKQVNTQAQALLHYFSFLEELNIGWDEIPITSRNKPTYRFSNHLKTAVMTGSLARTTANNYLGSVVNFYKFYLAKDYPFVNKPFNFELIKILVEGNHKHMREKIIYVNTTDIRLNLPKVSSFKGVARSLVPLSDREWHLVDDICRIKGKAISNQNGGSILVGLSQEFKIAVALARYTGLRREELITFRIKFIYKPSTDQLNNKYLIHTDGVFISPQLGVETKGSGSRTIEIPSALMMTLHQYINSKRYIERRTLYEINNPNDSANPPLLITQKGRKYASRTFNARWGEVRNSVRLDRPSFDHKFHNLRSTYAVSRLKELLNQGIKEGDALDYIQSVMGHKSRSTLLHYLKFCQQEISANELYEQTLDVILKD